MLKRSSLSLLNPRKRTSDDATAKQPRGSIREARHFTSRMDSLATWKHREELSPHELKTIITRAGEGTKIVLTGDTMQIDSPYLDSFNNGLAVVVNCFKMTDIAGHVTLVKGERSRLSELAISLMH